MVDVAHRSRVDVQENLAQQRILNSPLAWLRRLRADLGDWSACSESSVGWRDTLASVT